MNRSIRAGLVSGLIGLTLFFCLAAGSIAAEEGEAGKRGWLEGDWFEEGWFKPKFEEKISYRFRKNSHDLNKSSTPRSYMKFITRAGTLLKPHRDLEFFFRITNLNQPYFRPHFRYNIDEWVFDQFYVNMRNILGHPFSVTVGRQNMWYGDGFVIADGTPGDIGPRTDYFNAAKASLKFGKNRLDGFAAFQPRQDRFLVINSQKTQLNNFNTPIVDTWGAYFMNRSMESCHLDAYYIYKHEYNTRDVVDLNVMGLRARGNLWRHLHYAMEGACQFGGYGPERENVSAFGTDIQAMYHFPMQLKPGLGLEHVYLSGDDPDTSGYEGWNPVFSQWPKWNVLSTWLLMREGGPCCWTNMQMLRVKGMLMFTENQDFTAVYNYWLANQKTFRGRIGFGDGYVRGHLMQAIYNIIFNEHFRSKLQVEYLIPGDFYVDDADCALIIKLDFTLTF